MKKFVVNYMTVRKVLLVILSAVAVLFTALALKTVLLNCVDAYAEDTQGESFYVYGAAVRQMDDEYDAAVKFHILMSDSLYNELGIEQNENAVTGVLVVPTVLKGDGLTVDTVAAEERDTTDKWYQSEIAEGYMESVAYIYDIPQANYGTDLSIVGYYTVDGENYVYTSEKNASLAYVASEADAASGETAYSGYYTFKLTYGGDTENAVTVTYGEKLDEPQAPDAQFGKVFEGWSDATGSVLWNFAQDEVTGNVNLYAKYRTIISGAGTEADPYLILNDEGFEYFVQKVNGGESFEEMYFKLDADITGVTTMIGTSSAVCFEGSFDGGGHSVTVDIESNTAYTALFLYNKATLQNLTVKGKVSGTNCVAGIVAYNHGVIYNCVNEADVSGTDSVGGIAAFTRYTIENCTNKGAVTADYIIGGIAARTELSSAVSESVTVSNCVNEGGVTSTSVNTSSTECDGGYWVGGIVGLNGSGCVISQCTNSGTVTGVGGIKTGSSNALGAGVGGIAGINYGSTSSIEYCENSGRVNGYYYYGGIAGVSLGGISDSVNNGEIAKRTTESGSNSGYAGGIVGYLAAAVTDCTNLGNVSAGFYLAGIAGEGAAAASVKGSYNGSETVKPVICSYSSTAAAGIIGYWLSTTETAVTSVSDCVNYGTITYDGSASTVNANHFGGIVGMCGHYHQITGCTNYGDVTGVATASAGVGGIVASTYTGNVIENCVNYGNVKGNSDTNVGQIVGYNSKSTDTSTCTESGTIVTD